MTAKMAISIYPKIDVMNDMLRNKFMNCPNSHKCDWYVSEMIDGAHLALYANHVTGFFKAATRKRFLEDTDIYFDFKDVVKLHRQWTFDVSQSIKGPIIVYGKIVGGKYKGQKRGVQVNSVCEYMVHNDYVVHDIKTSAGFLSHHELENLGNKHVLTLAPTLFTGAMSKVWGFPENKLSALPFIHDLPVNYENEMKGIVIRPIHDLNGYNSRLIAKKLNRKYIGKKDTPVEKPTISDTLIEIADHIENQATKLCILNAIMIANEGFNYNEIDKIAGKYVQRMLDMVNYVKYNLLTSTERTLVNKELNKIARDRLLTIYRAGNEAA